ncbi:MAG: radical SAM protein [Elusimicrobiota bacterium]|jgi:radical SAM superfamily enzyme YgiQ (UPF0313 family)
MKVLLVNPPHRFARGNPFARAGLALPPLGLLHVAARLRESRPGVRVAVLDAPALRLEGAAFERALAAAEPDLAGVSVYTGNYSSATAAGRALKRLFPSCRTVAGGPHASLRPEETLAEGGFDAVVLGEGEETFARLAAAWGDGGDPSAVPNLVLPGPRRTAADPAPLDLDRLPPPARDLLDPAPYRPSHGGYRRLPVASLVSSRGCPYACRFCSKAVFGARWRAQSPERTFSELRTLADEGWREASFQDDVFTFDRERTLRLCARLGSARLDLTWTCMTRVDRVDAELLRAMAAAGCVSIAYGMESGDPEVLARMGKGLRPEDARAALAWTRAAGIESRAYYVLGHPGESEASLRRTVEEAVRADPDFVFFSFAFPIPGTPLYDEARAAGLLLRDGRELYDTADFTEPVLRVGAWGPAELNAFVRKAYRRFYLRPRCVLRRLAALRSPSELARAVSGALSVLRSS